MNKTLLDLLPKTKELLEKSKSKPSVEQRVEALESAMVDLAIQMMEVDTDA
jgi:hypothetical protein